LSALHGVIRELGLLDESPEAEAVRNVMINPLAGIDPAESFDVREIASELAQRLSSEQAFWALPSKFGFIVDGGGSLTLADQRADIRLAAIRDGAEFKIAIALDTTCGIEWLGSTAPVSAARTAIATARVFLDAATREPRQRMRDLSPAGLAFLRS